MKDNECVQFLQWALPKLHMQWPGFRKVRAQVCKRIDRRLRQLNLENVAAYRSFLESHPDEWTLLDALTRITISRFYRAKAMFAFLEQEVLPELVQQTVERNEDCLKVWSAGCGSGEEPYTLAIIWMLRLQLRFPNMRLKILATDIDPNMIRRAHEAHYLYSSIKNLPQDWREQAFDEEDAVYTLKPTYRQHVVLHQQDIREQMPDERFDLVLCRNLAFTYFDEELQYQTAERIQAVMQSGGALVIGIHEHLPAATKGFETWSDRLKIYRKEHGK